MKSRYFQVLKQHPLNPRVPGFQAVLQKPFFRACLGMLYTKKKKNASFIVFGITVETLFTDISYGYLSITDINADK